MRLAATIVLIAAVALVPQADGRTRAPAAVSLVSCAEAGVFQAKADAIPRTARIAVRLTLFERTPGGSFQPVVAPDLGRWRSSRPGASRFVYTHRVENLRAGGLYRMQARFRWLDASGATLRSARRRSPVCTAGGSLPNLVVKSVELAPGPRPGTAAYVVVVRNTGTADAEDTNLSLRVDGSPLPAAPLAPVRALGERRLELAGPPCGRMVTATADPADAVRESDESDNHLTVSCASR